MAYIAMAYIVVAYIVLAYTVMAYMVMVSIVMVCAVMAYVVMAYVVMGPIGPSIASSSTCHRTKNKGFEHCHTLASSPTTDLSTVTGTSHGSSSCLYALLYTCPHGMWVGCLIIFPHRRLLSDVAMARTYTGHNYIGRKHIGLNYIVHNYTGHDYSGHIYIGHKGGSHPKS